MKYLPSCERCVKNAWSITSSIPVLHFVHFVSNMERDLCVSRNSLEGNQKWILENKLC
jgi:hypothetical protein